MDLMHMWDQMGWVAKAIGVILIIMSMISFGVAIERIYTFAQARKQSKLYAPQVAKHLKEGRLKDAIAISSSKNYRYSHLAKVVLAGLQEYQFQQESGANLSREDLVDTVRRAIQRASALTANDLKKGVSALATIGAISIMMMRSTSMTSTSGVTLMSDLGPPLEAPTSIAIVLAPSCRQSIVDGR